MCSSNLLVGAAEKLLKRGHRRAGAHHCLSVLLNGVLDSEEVLVWSRPGRDWHPTVAATTAPGPGLDLSSAFHDSDEVQL